MDFLDDKEETKGNNKSSQMANIICVSFNQDRSWLACGTTLGFRVYDTQTMKMIDSNEGKDFSLNSGVCSISLLSKTILVSIITDGLNSNYPNTIVYLWDKYTKEPKKEFKHTAKVDTAYLVPKRLFTLSQNNILIWDLETATVLELISTSSDSNTFFLNSLNKASIALVHQNDKKLISFRNISAKVETVIKPEVPAFQTMTLSNDLSYLAVVDVSGIYIYIYDVRTSKLAFEFIRGKTQSKISCIQFSDDSQFLMLMNEKGTLHIFKLEEKNKVRNGPENEGGIFNTFTQYVPKILSKPSSFAKYHPLPERLSHISWIDSLRSRIDGPFFNIQKDGAIMVFFPSGKYHTLKFDKNEGGECQEVTDVQGKAGDWFDPFVDQYTNPGNDDEDDYIVI